MSSALACIASGLLPVFAATSPDGDVLASRLQEILAAEALAGARTAVYVRRLSDGAAVFAHEPDALLIPASNVKIVTSSAALQHFGPDHRFNTEALLVPAAPGGAAGDLFVKGYGDPSLVPERLWYLATRVFFSGVREVGNIVVDDTYFAGARMANGWEQDRSDSAYMAPSGAVSVGFNSVLVHVLPGQLPGAAARVLVDPVSDYAVIDAAVSTVARGRTYVSVDVVPHGDRSRIRVTGRIHVTDEGRGFWRRIDNPPVFAGEVLKATLLQVGVKVRGKVVVAPTPAGAVRVATVASPRLAEIVSALNKNSNNFMAEQLALALGAARFGAPGTWDKAQAAIDDFLTGEVGLAPGTYTVGNASGLHDVNRMSPRQMVAVLAYMHHHPEVFPEFATSLAVAGSSGTLADRMRATDAAHLLRAKTGTLANASALSGYVTTRSGDLLAFSIIVNDYQTRVADVWSLQDRMGALLAGLNAAAEHDARVARSPGSAGVEAAAP